MKLGVSLLFCATLLAACSPQPELNTTPPQRPNILIAIADDWGWPHAGAYGDPVVKTPAFDRVAREGVLFHHAFVSSPSCTPSRSAILTGQYHWRLEEGANLWSTLQTKFPVYPDLLEDAGYFVGFSGKGWGPGRPEPGGRSRNPAGPRFDSFVTFLQDRPTDQPFCFWFGASDPHRPYQAGSGLASGMDLDRIRLPAALPDRPEVRGDVADYYWEVQRFDRDVGLLLAILEESQELDRTLIVITGDHGMPFPRAKGNLYDSGTRVPLAIRWPAAIAAPRTSSDFVSLTDLAPTFLEAAGLEPPRVMTGRSLKSLLETAEAAGDDSRNSVLTGKERHVPCQESPQSGGTPMRALRTADYLYIRNFEPDRWPAGTPHSDRAYFEESWYGDVDNGPSKFFMIRHRQERGFRRLYQLAFAKRPAEELYDLRQDPDQLIDVARFPGYQDARERLAAELNEKLAASGDPRLLGGGEKFDSYPYYGGTPRKPENW